MSDSITLDLYNRSQARDIIKSQLFPFLASALQGGGRWVLTVKPQTRSDAQNRRLWSMLSDLSEQVDWHGNKLTDWEWKDVMTAALKRQKVVPGIDGGFVVCGQRTSKMTKAEMAELQTLMEAFGAQQGVQFKVWEGE